MEYQAAESEQKRAKTPHELFVLNLIGFHLLLTPATIALGVGLYGLLLPLTLSALVLGYIYVRALRARRHEPWLVMLHWQLAWRRGKLLIAAYGGSALIFALAALMTMGIEKEATRHIMFTTFTRIAVMPTFIMVLITFVLSTSSMAQIARGEVPDKLAERFPPPGQGE